MKNILKLAFLIVLAFILTACGTGNENNNDSSTGNEGTEQVEDNQSNKEESAERAMLVLGFEVKGFDVDNNSLNVSFDSNLPDDTVIYRAVLKDEEGTNRLIEYEVLIDEAREIAFSLDGIDKATLTDKEYQLVFEFNVTQRTNSNLFTDKSLGGSFAEMDEFYQDSEQVLLTDLGVDDAYSITLTSANSNPITEDFFAEESANE